MFNIIDNQTKVDVEYFLDIKHQIDNYDPIRKKERTKFTNMLPNINKLESILRDKYLCKNEIITQYHFEIRFIKHTHETPGIFCIKSRRTNIVELEIIFHAVSSYSKYIEVYISDNYKSYVNCYNVNPLNANQIMELQDLHSKHLYITPLKCKHNYGCMIPTLDELKDRFDEELVICADNEYSIEDPIRKLCRSYIKTIGG